MSAYVVSKYVTIATGGSGERLGNAARPSHDKVNLDELVLKV